MFSFSQSYFQVFVKKYPSLKADKKEVNDAFSFDG